MPRVLQISDTHLSPDKRQFAVNWTPLRDWIVRLDADLAIHTGDLTVDGADNEADMREGAALMRSLPVEVLAVPGNHDVGEAGNPYQPVNAERLDRWRRYFGPDWWSRDLENWRLIGLDSMLFGSGSDEEALQFDWLDRIMSTAGGRKIAWFTHRPLFIERPDEADTGYWSVKPAPRARLLERVRRHHVALICTGHLHKWRDHEVDGCRYIWCAASSFLVGPENQPDIPGEKRLGAAIHEFNDSEVSITPAVIPNLTTLWIDDVRHEVYPPRHAA